MTDEEKIIQAVLEEETINRDLMIAIESLPHADLVHIVKQTWGIAHGSLWDEEGMGKRICQAIEDTTGVKGICWSSSRDRLPDRRGK